MAIFRRRPTPEELLTQAVARGAVLPDWDRTVVAQCTVNLSVVEGGPSSGNAQRPISNGCLLVLTHTSVVVVAHTVAQAFPVQEIGFGTMGIGGFVAHFLAPDGNWYWVHAYSERELAQFIALTEVQTEHVRKIEDMKAEAASERQNSSPPGEPSQPRPPSKRRRGT